MNIITAEDNSAVLTDAFGLATWNRPRSSEELQAFIASHHDRLPDDVEVE